MFDVNVRLLYAVRCIGKAWKFAQCFTDMLQKASEMVCGNSMKTGEAISL
jgi:hypothetical protein